MEMLGYLPGALAVVGMAVRFVIFFRNEGGSARNAQNV
jgi:hypothetical protein